jgi:hypothetical protein
MNFFEESELERQQRLYELQRLYQEYEQGNLNDISDDISAPQFLIWEKS